MTRAIQKQVALIESLQLRMRNLRARKKGTGDLQMELQRAMTKLLHLQNREDRKAA